MERALVDRSWPETGLESSCAGRRGQTSNVWRHGGRNARAWIGLRPYAECRGVETMIAALLLIALIGCGDNSTGPDVDVFIASLGSAERWDGTRVPSHRDRYFAVLVTDREGNPVADKRVGWQIVGPQNGKITESSTLTDEQGRAVTLVRGITTYIVRGKAFGTRVKATVFGYGASVNIDFVDGSVLFRAPPNGPA